MRKQAKFLALNVPRINAVGGKEKRREVVVRPSWSWASGRTVFICAAAVVAGFSTNQYLGCVRKQFPGGALSLPLS